MNQLHFLNLNIGDRNDIDVDAASLSLLLSKDQHLNYFQNFPTKSEPKDS